MRDEEASSAEMQHQQTQQIIVQNQEGTKTEPLVFSRDEAPFKFEELFFSRTDERGIILAGNGVFQRISGYSWEELIHKPHNLIRHPDMPKAVFWLLWRTIKQGKPIGAYVKNKSKDGRFYWVFAIVAPIEGGYLSVRLKPSSDVFDTVRNAYQTLLPLEMKLSPEESANTLLGTIQSLGFEDYSAFMGHALKSEIAARNQALETETTPILEIFSSLAQSSNKLVAQANAISKTYNENASVPLNLKVQAAKLGEDGRTINVISQNYTELSEEINESMKAFMEAVSEVRNISQEGLFLVGVELIQNEVCEHFSNEKSDGFENEMQLLNEQQTLYHHKAYDGIQKINVSARRFKESCLHIKRLISGLHVTRVMGRVETAKINNVSKSSLSELINDLDHFQHYVSEQMEVIQRLNSEMKSKIDRLMER